MKIEVRLEGYIGRDFQVITSPRTSFATGVLAVSNVVGNYQQLSANRNGEAANGEESNTTAWFDLTCFQENVVNNANLYKKGMYAQVIGTLTFEPYVTRDGRNGESKRVNVREIRILCANMEQATQLQGIAQELRANRGSNYQANRGGYNNQAPVGQGNSYAQPVAGYNNNTGFSGGTPRGTTNGFQGGAAPASNGFAGGAPVNSFAKAPATPASTGGFGGAPTAAPAPQVAQGFGSKPMFGNAKAEIPEYGKKPAGKPGAGNGGDSGDIPF